MIKARMSTPERGEIVLFGLSRENINRLTAGQPIKIDMEQIGLPKGEILIYFGETEAQMNRDLRKAGMVTDDTVQHLEPPL